MRIYPPTGRYYHPRIFGEARFGAQGMDVMGWICFGRYPWWSEYAICWLESGRKGNARPKVSADMAGKRAGEMVKGREWIGFYSRLEKRLLMTSVPRRKVCMFVCEWIWPLSWYKRISFATIVENRLLAIKLCVLQLLNLGKEQIRHSHSERPKASSKIYIPLATQTVKLNPQLIRYSSLIDSSSSPIR